MDGERLWELRTLDLLLGGLSCLCSPLEFAVLLRVTVLNVLQQVGLLHVEERTLGAGKDLGGHLHGGTYAKHGTVCCVVAQKCKSLSPTTLPDSDTWLRPWFLAFTSRSPMCLLLLIIISRPLFKCNSSYLIAVTYSKAAEDKTNTAEISSSTLTQLAKIKHMCYGWDSSEATGPFSQQFGDEALQGTHCEHLT